MRTHYHEFESLEHLLSQRLLPGGNREPIRFVVFGGTGAVGGASVMELCRMILRSTSLRERPLRGEIYATGTTDKEISSFASRLYLALDDDHAIEKVEPLRHYRVDRRIDLRFSLLRLELPHGLEQEVGRRRQELGGEFELEQVAGEYFAAQECPFLRFVESLDCDLLHAVLVAIPLPSVATYALGKLERLTAAYGAQPAVQKRLKSRYLRTFTRGLAVVQQLHSRRVLIAHTTAVGGMYRVDGGSEEIRLGFAHSSLGRKMAEKRHFANELTQLYLDHGFDVLVTAAAIGIDAVDFHCRLPSNGAVRRALLARRQTAVASDAEAAPIPAEDLDRGEILLYPCHDLALEPPADDGPRALRFGAGKELRVDAAVRSGENGLFSPANCIALYNVMKVTIPEELAMVLVRHAVFGRERRRDWFDNQICYYRETENCYFALRLLDNHPRLRRAHHGPFSVQAYQALGSATHQARLHEIGLVMLTLRLRELGELFEEIPQDELAAALSCDLDDYLWRRTRIPAFEDFGALRVEWMAQLLGELCEVDSMESAGRLLGYDPRRHARRERGREKFLARLATRIGRYLQTITSLGIPIVYRRPVDKYRLGKRPPPQDRVLVGPYVAPLDAAVAASDDLEVEWRALAGRHGAPFDAVRDWTIVNNGFVDLRPHALATSAQEPGPKLAQQVHAFGSGDELLAWIRSLGSGTYFTTGGLIALQLRLGRLFEQVRRRKVELGTRETWKHLFECDDDDRHLISPGLVETVRMYSEGLGKVTGTEALWPWWGY